MAYPPTMLNQMLNPMQMQPIQSMPYLPQCQQQQSGINGVTEVQGLAGAQACQIPAGTTALLMDASDPFFFIKSVNANGVATIKQFRFEEHDPQAEQMKGYVTREEFEAWKEQHEPVHQQPAATAATGPDVLHPIGQPQASAAADPANARQWADQPATA